MRAVIVSRQVYRSIVETGDTVLDLNHYYAQSARPTPDVCEHAQAVTHYGWEVTNNHYE